MSHLATHCPSGIAARNLRSVQPCVPEPIRPYRTASFEWYEPVTAPARGSAAAAVADADVLRNLRRVSCCSLFPAALPSMEFYFQRTA